MQPKHLLSLPLIIGGLVLSACSPSPSESDTSNNGSRQLNILASFLPMHAHAAAIAGDRAQVEALVAGGVGAHDYTPRPADIRRLAEADLLVINGAGMETWIEALIPQADNPALKIVDLSESVPLISNQSPLDQIEAGEHSDGHEHNHGHGHSHGHSHGAESEANPHIWLDPVIAMQQVETLRDALIAADPEGSATYQRNAEAYLKQLRTLDAEFRSVLEPLPSKKLITFHDAFPYLAARYDFDYLGYVAQFPERDPSPRELAALLDRIRSAGVKVLFAEVGYEPALLQRIATSTGARISVLDTLEVGDGGPEAYLDGMRKNLEALRKAFAAE